MPLARIITDAVDESLELTMQLRSRGFQVETVAPGDVPSTPADLEVRLEECNSEDVLTRTAQVSEADDLWVFVAPGALDESVRPIRTIPLVPPVIRIPEVKPPQPKSKLAPAVVPFAVPEDDPILLEINMRANPVVADVRPANGNGLHSVRVPSPAVLPATVAPAVRVVPKNGSSHRTAELPSQTTEVVQFPATAEAQVRLRSVGGDVAPAASVRSYEPAAISADELRFWRFASVTAALAIAALLLGINFSRTPEAGKSMSKPSTTFNAVVPPTSHKAAAIPSTRQLAVPAQPKPAAAKTNNPAVSRPPIELAAKTVRLHKPVSRRPARRSSDDVARDTVVYFDRKGRPAVQKPQSNISHSDVN